MTKEQEEAIKMLEKFITEHKFFNIKHTNGLEDNIGIVLQALKDSVPKKKIQCYLKEEQERFEIYKKESEINENLKLGTWKHLGAKNMCEKILGIEKNITTLD